MLRAESSLPPHCAVPELSPLLTAFSNRMGTAGTSCSNSRGASTSFGTVGAYCTYSVVHYNTTQQRTYSMCSFTRMCIRVENVSTSTVLYSYRHYVLVLYTVQHIILYSTLSLSHIVNGINRSSKSRGHTAYGAYEIP